jgi:hypothetical protein
MPMVIFSRSESSSCQPWASHEGDDVICMFLSYMVKEVI